MNLRNKTVIVISVVLAVMIMVIYTTSQIIMENNFNKMEESYSRKNVDRALDALNDDISRIEISTGDWAGWDDTYTFIENANEEYIESNLFDEAFSTERVNLRLFFNSSGLMVYSKAFDIENQTEIPVPRIFQNLSSSNPIIQHNDTESKKKGILILPEGPMLVSSLPILTNEGKGPIRGTLIFGRFLDSKEIEELSEKAQLSITFWGLDDPAMPSDLYAVRSILSKEKK